MNTQNNVPTNSDTTPTNSDTVECHADALASSNDEGEDFDEFEADSEELEAESDELGLSEDEFSFDDDGIEADSVPSDTRQTADVKPLSLDEIQIGSSDPFAGLFSASKRSNAKSEKSGIRVHIPREKRVSMAARELFASVTFGNKAGAWVESQVPMLRSKIETSIEKILSKHGEREQGEEFGDYVERLESEKKVNASKVFGALESKLREAKAALVQACLANDSIRIGHISNGEFRCGPMARVGYKQDFPSKFVIGMLASSHYNDGYQKDENSSISQTFRALMSGASPLYVAAHVDAFASKRRDPIKTLEAQVQAGKIASKKLASGDNLAPEIVAKAKQDVRQAQSAKLVLEAVNLRFEHSNRITAELWAELEKLATTKFEEDEFKALPKQKQAKIRAVRACLATASDLLAQTELRNQKLKNKNKSDSTHNLSDLFA